MKIHVHGNRAWVFYFTHPEVSGAARQNPDLIWKYRHRRTSLQVAESKIVEQFRLTCERNQVELDILQSKDLPEKNTGNL